jgi:hypothetical protein
LSPNHLDFLQFKAVNNSIENEGPMIIEPAFTFLVAKPKQIEVSPN